ncbi:uncharacterized protein LOC122663397 isoform X2 [Telopea speciosissima]|uniref:uncharacterized protein LOC122663397 isoform X2 n=1 Tax=Telopea speciosissima TaxID=54955 RepID=UPI001CC33D0A|nr:uncharacterized protein LOC122663397 isoform X2 [Telopea speciosissima]
MASIRHDNKNSSSSSNDLQPLHNFSRFVQSASSNFFSLFNLSLNNSSSSNKTCNAKTWTTSPPSGPLSVTASSSSVICVPFLLADAPRPPIPSLSNVSAAPSSSSTSSDQSSSFSSSSASASASAIKGVSQASGFPSTVRVGGLNSTSKGGGPAFVGQVFSMCDLSGNGLMAVSTRLEIPFLSKRIPEWIKKMFAIITKNGKDGPVFRFFMDLGDAVAYVEQFDIPTGVVGACGLDLAYGHFKEKPHMFEFVPNEKQVKAANKLLKRNPQSCRRRIDGVPVFTAENLDFAIATSDGIKRYTPYFFDKNMLDNILEDSVDQHFHTLIQNRHMQRRRDVIDDNLAEVVEDSGESLWEPPEVQEMLDEMGHPGIPLSVISKAAEMQLLYTVDKVLLGNRWLRKATGIQPKFPYMVDSFEERSAASFLRTTDSMASVADSGAENVSNGQEWQLSSSELNRSGKTLDNRGEQTRHKNFRFPFGLVNPWSKQVQMPENQMKTDSRECVKQEPLLNPLLPKITMVGISTGGEAGQISKASLKRTMEDLTRDLEQTGQKSSGSCSSELRNDDRDPLFVANVGEYFSMTKTSSGKWVHGGNN